MAKFRWLCAQIAGEEPRGGGRPLDSNAVSSSPTSMEPLDSLPSVSGQQQAPNKRNMWANKVEFLLAVIGFSVDLGNVWRFPYVCYRNGGGAFLIPYFVMFLLCGLPMFYMELALGQYFRCGCISIWSKLVPFMKGIGYAVCIIDCYIGSFYNTIIAWAVFYLAHSFTSDLPWQSCNHTWNTDKCSNMLTNLTDDVGLNGTVETGTKSSAAEQFYTLYLQEINRSSGLGDLGGIKWSLALCLAAVYIVVYFSIWKGPVSSGKVVWVTAILPYIILTALLIRGLTLPGSSVGIYYFLTPRWNKLLEVKVWIDAATQIFFSLGPGFGVLITLASYNDFSNNFHRDAIATGVINCFTSILCGFVIFSTLGYMANLLNKDIAVVVGDGGPGLIFIVYPQAIATMAAAPAWSVIFFAMLISLGIDSTFAGLETVVTAFCDEYSSTIGNHRKAFTFIFMVFIFIISLPTVTYGGNYVVEYLDYYGVSYSILIIVIAEIIAVSYIWGIRRLLNAIKEMLGFQPNVLWTICWVFVSPLAVLLIVTFAFLGMKPLQIHHYAYPSWSMLIGWLILTSSCMFIPLYIACMLLKTAGSLSQRFTTVFKLPKPKPAVLVNNVVSEAIDRKVTFL